MKTRMKRRHFLRGAAGGLGAAVGLPPLQAMFASDRAHAAGAAGLPRFLAIYQPNGHQQPTYLPRLAGGKLDFTGRNSEPLEPWLPHLTILARMVGTHAATKGDNSHGAALVSWLTGRPVPTANETRHSLSADRLIAERYDQRSATRAQHLGITGSPYWEPQEPDDQKNKEFNDWITSDRNGNKILPTPDLDKVFDRMFGGVPAAPPGAQGEARRAFGKSVLDFVLEDAKRVEQRIGAADKQILGSYLDDIRALERRLAQPLPAGASAACGGTFKPTRKWPTERRNRARNEYIDEHFRDTVQLLKVGFQCEATRSVAYLMEPEGGESGYANAGLASSHKAAHNNYPDYGKRDQLHAKLLVELLTTFKATPLGAGTLLDSTMIVFGAGAGFNHATNNQTTVLAGFRGNGIKHGTMRDFNNGASAIPLMRTLLLHLGVLDEGEGFGDAGSKDVIDLVG